MPSHPILRVDNVSFVRNHRTILDAVSWTVNTGEHWALLGANGSGKTTLLKLLTGYEWATSGQIEVLGRRFGETDVRELRKVIGWVSSSLEHRLPSEDKAIDIVVSGFDASLGVHRRFDDNERRLALHALRSVGGETLERKRYGILSQGERQRVLIARALVGAPALLILDEACAGLDPASRAQFLNDIGRVANSPQAPTIIFVTHHIDEIGPWQNRVLVLKEGRVLVSGTPEATVSSSTLSDALSTRCVVYRTASGFRLEFPEP